MPSFRERLDELTGSARITLKERELQQFEQYYQLLQRWNDRINLTALPVTGYPSATLNRLFLEPIIAAALVASGPLTWFDLGSGGGSPAIPLKVLRPAARLTMVESRERKAAFLREVLRTLDLPDADVLARRFEDVSRDEPRSADLITVRAVKTNDQLWDTCGSLLRNNGQLLLFVSSTIELQPPSDFQVIHRVPVPNTDSAVLEFARVFHSPSD